VKKIPTLELALGIMGDDHKPLTRADVAARVLNCKIWVSGSGQPGCLYDYGPNYSRTREQAIEDMCFVADSETGVPRGMKTALRRYGSFTDSRGVQYEVSQDTLGSVLS
jgi:hypothetical protein